MDFINERGIRERETTGTSNKKLAESIYAKALTEVKEGAFIHLAKVFSGLTLDKITSDAVECEARSKNSS